MNTRRPTDEPGRTDGKPNPKLTEALLRGGARDPSILAGNVAEMTLEARVKSLVAEQNIRGIFALVPDMAALNVAELAYIKSLLRGLPKDALHMPDLDKAIKDARKQQQASARVAAKTGDWRDMLLTDARGNMLSVVANALIALENSPEWDGVLHFNESSFDTVARKAPPWEDPRPLPFTWTDEDDVRAAAWMQHQGILAAKETASQAIQTVARENPFHPVREYLNSLEWDGVKRLESWLTLYLGAEATDYTRAVGSKWMIGAVARIFLPGCKCDCCLILEGTQGSLKSTTLRTLASPWFTDDMPELGTKDSALQTRGVWIIELAELDSMARSDVNRIKSFMSRAMDRFRPPFGRRPIEAPRECIFAGTVNHSQYLKDETGGRRFWPITCGVIRIPEIKRDRDQLWAEAHAQFKTGASWWLEDKGVIRDATVQQQERYEGDPWDELIADWLRDPSPRCDMHGNPVAPITSNQEFVTIAEVLIHCIGKRPDAWSQVDKNRVARSLRSFGWIRKQKRTVTGREWRYEKSPVLVPDDSEHANAVNDSEVAEGE